MKRIVMFLLIMVSAITIWYLFIKKYDYEVAFSVKGAPGSIYHQIIGWESWGEDLKTKNVTTLDTLLYREVRQKVILQDTVLNLDWNIASINDSISKIKVGVLSESHSLMNRLRILTGETIFTKSLKREFKKFGKGVNDFSKTFRINIQGESQLPELEYLYVSSASNRSNKAGMMMQTNSDLFPKITKSKTQVNGAPFVSIKEWNRLDDKIVFDFGFPIKHTDSLPVNSIVKYKKSLAKRALKATFYGNYRYSDQAWFALIEYAKRRNILIDKKPLEIFYNNPMQDGDASKWKAEIFMPLK